MKNLVRILSVVYVLVVILSTQALAAPKDWPSKLIFGLIPTESSSGLTERFDNLVTYLERTLGVKVELKTATDYAGIITGMQFKHLDFAYFGPKSYAEASKRANAEAFVLEVLEDGTKGYYGVIITKKGSGLNTIQSLKGKLWAFTDPNSTSGTLVPTVYFVKELKIDPDTYFAKVIFSGSHEASILAVKGGKVDGASTNDLDLARGNGKQWVTEQDFNILWQSALIPGSPMAYRKDLPDSLKKALRQAFLSYHDPEGLKMLKLKGYAPATDELYNPIRDLIEVQKQLKK